jgi:hypothetical protein
MAEILCNEMDIIEIWHTMPSAVYLVGVLITGLCFAAWRVRQYRYTCATATTKTKPVLSEKKEPVITPLKGFEWESTEPLQFRPFKGKEKFNLTMCEYSFTRQLLPYVFYYIKISRNVYRLTSISN